MIVRSSLMKTLHTLKTRHRCVGIKTSFEDEGANFNDIIKLRRLTSDTGIQLSLKVGGAEAKTDIKSSVDICCDSIVGPMIESQYAFDKYALSCKKLPTRKGVNIETITAIQNMDLILSSQYLDEIDYFVIGRVDLVGSLGKSRDSVDDAENLSMIESTFRKIKQHGKKTYLGGSISSKSKEFIRHLYDQNILDYIETRYIIMKLDPTFFDTFDDAIVTSHQFELEWMQHLYTKYSDMSAGFHTRMQMAQARVNTTFKIDGVTLWYDTTELESDVLKVCDYTVTFTDGGVTTRSGDFIISDERFRHMFSTSDNVFYIVATEENKTIDTVMSIIRALHPGVKRIVIVGGGLVQDVGSFVCSVYNRGKIPWVYFPTTLLSMADSCIGSKTSLNTSFKNKIGTYCSPESVYINMKFLDTLDDVQIRSGKGEILKLCMIGNALDMYNTLDLKSLVKLSLLIKKSVIEVDLHDKHVRKGLNYGHTLGHAIEVVSNYTMPHGLAVVHGMLLMNKIFGYTHSVFEHHCLELIQGTPISELDCQAVIEQDKKMNTDGTITCIVPSDNGLKFITSSSQKIQDQLELIDHL